MGARKGNKNALGNKGGRRPTEKEERQHLLMWHNDTTVSVLEKKILVGKYSISDVYYLRALKGDVKVLNNLANKVLADKKQISGIGDEGEVIVRWLKE